MKQSPMVSPFKGVAHNEGIIDEASPKLVYTIESRSDNRETIPGNKNELTVSHQLNRPNQRMSRRSSKRRNLKNCKSNFAVFMEEIERIDGADKKETHQGISNQVEKEFFQSNKNISQAGSMGGPLKAVFSRGNSWGSRDQLMFKGCSYCKCLQVYSFNHINILIML